MICAWVEKKRQTGCGTVLVLVPYMISSAHALAVTARRTVVVVLGRNYLGLRRLVANLVIC